MTLREGSFLALFTGVSIFLAYQVERPFAIPPAGPLASLTYRDFYPAEGEWRWTRAESSILVPGLGPGRHVRIEALVDGWRPPRQDPPHLRITAGPATLDARPPRRGDTLVLETVTSGYWSGDLEIRFSSDTFTPGPQDPRSLGARLRGLRIIPLGPVPVLPPLLQLVAASGTVLLIFGLVLRLGSRALAIRLAGGAALFAAILYALARPYATVASGPLLWTFAGLALLVSLAPSLGHLVVEILRAGFAALLRGVKVLGLAPTAGLALGALLALVWAYRFQPLLDIEVGSGRETTLARGFGTFEGSSGVRFRRALRGAVLDLRDFGGGSDWTIDVTASLPDGPRRLLIAQAEGATLEAALDGGWTSASFVARPAVSWRSGLVVEFPETIRLGRVRVDRGQSLPSGFVLSSAFLGALLVVVALGAVGLGARAAFLAAGVFLSAETAALAADPVTTVPFVGGFLVITALGALLAALLEGLSETLARRGPIALSPTALAAAAGGFVAWLSATSFPLYRGGHFVFHSSIAEEIWKGRFLIYYLPFPGSMLSRQAQWGDIVVPHPCLYHTLVSPLAAFPQPWFYLLEKGVLALFFTAMTVATALLATREGGPRAGAYASLLAVGLVPTFQLLGLGHLMTILGCLAMTLAMTVLVFGFERLGERRVGWTLTAALTFCFLSYTAALLFEGCVLALSLLVLARSAPGPSRALAQSALTATLLAFLLYYANWAWPFLRESVPRILHGSAAHAATHGTPVWSRLALVPGKLAYSYGSALIPVLGLAGLALVPRSPDRVFLALWGGILVAFSGVDLYFNLLLKHHYFTMTPIAVGGGLFLASLWERGWAFRVFATALLMGALFLGGLTAIAVARGEIP
jgi:hypothetical protein